MEIKIVRTKISKDELKKLAQAQFGDMVKAVVDIQTGVMAIGGELHSDAEALLIDDGSSQQDLWGINLYPESQRNLIEYKSLINIRPHQNNRSLGIQDENIKAAIKKTVDGLLT